jgi:ribosomal protein S18 acetylase RimI-like enzyme
MGNNATYDLNSNSLVRFMSIIVRTATLADIDQLLRLEQELIAYERKFDKTFKLGKVSYYNIESLITDNNSQLVVAVDEEKIVGTGYGVIRDSESFVKSDHHAYLGFMIVKPEYRRNGVNRAVIDALISWSKSKGISEVRLEVYEQNEATISAYENYGFKKTTVKMHIEIIL